MAINMKRFSSKLNRIQFRIGRGVLVSIFVLLLIARIIFPYSVQMDLLHRHEPPSMDHPLGTDSMGRDLLSCLLFGMGMSLSIALTVIIITAGLGVFVGLIAGLYGGILDIILMRIVDILSAFPGILPALMIATFTNQGYWTLIFALSITNWVPYARIVRSEVLKFKHQDFILAARSYNASNLHILRYHMLPLVLPLVVVQASIGVPGIILAESSLNFLGIGLTPGLPTLGQLIDVGREYLFNDPRLVIAPGILLFTLVIGFIFMGEGLKQTRYIANI
jgi:ABC-type dipeptide/oligopeptide/nickel transport system permease subunit